MRDPLILLRRAIRTACALALASLSLQAGVLVVDDDGGPGVDHTTIQAAVDAALPGDTVLVRAGLYAGFGIHHKGVNVVAASGALVRVANEVAVRNLPAGEQVDLVGLVVDATSPYNRGLVASNNAGVIWVEGCELEGVPATSPGQWQLDGAQPGVYAVDTAHVALIRCDVRGGRGWTLWDEAYEPNASDGADALAATNSAVYVFEGTLTGGDGGSNYDTVSSDGGRGGDGVHFSGAPSFGYVSGATLVGGRGGSADESVWSGCGNGGRGGHGIYSPATSELYHRGCIFQPGVGGAPGGASCSWGADGSDVGPAGSVAVALPGVARHLSIQSPAVAGSTTLLEAEGEPGDLCWAQVAPPLDPEYLPVISSLRLIGLPRRLLFMGTLDGNGQLTRILPRPALATPMDSYGVHLQGYFKDASGNGHLGSGGHLLILGTAY